MVSNVNFSGGFYPNYSKKDIENLVKYVGGTEIVKNADGPFDGMGLMVGLTGATSAWQGVNWLRKSYKDSFDTSLTGDALKQAKREASPLRNKGWRTSEGWTTAFKNIKSAWATEVDKAKANGQTFKDNGGWKSVNAYKAGANNFRAQQILDCIPKDEKLSKLDENTRAIYAKAEKAAKLAKEGGEHSEKLIAAGDKYLSDARAMADGQIKPTGIFGKLFAGIKKYTGFTKASSWVKNLAKDSPIVSKMLKYGKGNGAFLAISGAIELLTQVLPTFATLGIGAGIKQTFKSTVKTVASVGGWAAGSAIGGMAAGAIAGTCTVPIVGTVIGGLLGLVGGCVGSWLATKAASGVVGENELDKAKDEQAKMATMELAKNPQELEQLVQAGAVKIQQNGITNDNDKAAMRSLISLSSRINQNAAGQYYGQPATGLNYSA